MRQAAIVFVGGGLGTSLRAILLAWQAPTGNVWPVLAINLLGAFALGAVFVLADEAGLLQAHARLFLAVGVLGGFTTFSTFGWGADQLLAGGDMAGAALYLGASLAGGVMAVAMGMAAARALAAAVELRGSGTGQGIKAIEAEDRD